MKVLSVGGRHVFALFVMAFSAVSAIAAPYPPEGLPTRWMQPDGSVLSLRVHGDELYGRTTTENGFTVIFNEADQAYYYAELAADQANLTRSAVRAEKQPPAGVAKQLREPKGVVAGVRQANIQKYAPEREQRWRARAANPAANPVEGLKVGLTILVQFPDVSFPVTQAKMQRFCNEAGYTDNGNTGSVRDYFYDQSLGKLTHTQSVTAVITLPNPRNYYNFRNYPNNTVMRDAGDAGRLLVQDAVSALNSTGFDVSSLTVNGSNQVVATSLLFAGPDSGVWAKGLWPHAWELASGGVSLGGKTVFRYQCTNVASSAPVIGTFAHELGHLLLDYPDLYDTDGGSEGIGEHCLMGSANHLDGGRTPGPINLYLKNVSGWATITDFNSTQHMEVTLPSTGNVGYRFRKPGSLTEYFLIENRGAGDKWATHCRDKGIAIWHIDEAITSDNMREEMTSNYHYRVSIQQADGGFDLERGLNRGDSGDLFDDTTSEFDDYNNPDANWWSGQESGLYMKALSAPGPMMSVRFGAPAGVTVLGINPASVVIPSGASSQSFFVNSNSAWTWTGKPAWITTTEAASQQGRQVFDYSVTGNPSVTPRTGMLTFTAGDITRTYTVTQQGKTVDDHGNDMGRATVVGPNSITAGNIEKAGDVDYFKVEVNGPGRLVIRSTGETDTFGALYSSTGAYLLESDDYLGLNFQLERETTKAETFYVAVKHFYASQTGPYQLECSFIPSSNFGVTAESQSVPQGGGTYTFTVTVPSGNWTAVREPLVTGGDVSWVTLNFTMPQTGTKTVSYYVPANTGSERTLKIRAGNALYSATHTVKQAGIPRPDLTDSGEAIIISPGVAVASGKMRIQMSVKNIGTVDAGPFNIKFQTSSGAISNYAPEIASLRVAGLEAGGVLPVDIMATLPASITVHYPDWNIGWNIDNFNEVVEMDETNNRIVAPQSIPRAVVELEVAPSTRSVEGGLVEGTVAATANAGWNWSSNVPWITSASTDFQVGNQTLTYQVTANPDPTPRTGVITFVSGGITRTHTVTQGAKPIPFEFTSFQKSGDNIAVSFRSEIGKTYRVATSTTLIPGSWEPVPGHTGIAGNGNPISRSLLNMGVAPTDGKRFFRIERE